jgi:hypothetical protein
MVGGGWERGLVSFLVVFVWLGFLVFMRVSLAGTGAIRGLLR